MFRNKTIKDIAKVTISNVIRLLAGILVGFLLPKIVDVDNYGYYKTFMLYSTYVGLLHFGFVDGLYLKYGGKDYKELERESFRLFSRFLFVLEITISLVLGVVFYFSLTSELKFIFVCLVAYSLFAQIVGYFQMISQITSRFNELSLRNVIQSVLICVSVLALWVICKSTGDLISYRWYILPFLFINFVLAVWYLITYREIVFGKSERIKNNCKKLFSFFILGFPLLVANLCSAFILAIDRQFVNALFDNKTYAVYAFAYNLLALITTALSAISTVIYPTLKKTNKETLKNNYSFLVRIILIFVFACLIVYFPLLKFIPWFLPNYINALPVFRVILPGLAVSSVITIVMHNYYKTDGKELMFFIKSIIVLVLSAAANVVAFFIFKTTISISIASIIVMIVWYFLIEEYFVRLYKVKWIRNCLYMFLMSAAFYLITIWDNWWAAMLVYFCILVGITYLFYWRDINLFIGKFLRKKDSNSSESSIEKNEEENKTNLSKE